MGIRWMGDPMAGKSLEERLLAHPRLRERVERLIEVAENTSGDFQLADEVERRVIEEVRQMGLDVLQDWAERGVDDSHRQARRSGTGVKGHGKKNSGGTRRSGK